jgi:hypothetical protein
MTGEQNRDRRQLLRCGLSGTLTALAGLAVKPARSQDFPKMTKEQAGYQEPAGDQLCAQCTSFQPPTDCKIVQGPISDKGTCNYFSQ